MPQSHGVSKGRNFNLKSTSPFSSAKSAIKTLLSGYYFSLITLFLGLVWLSDFRSQGYIDVGKLDPVVAEGGNALITIYGLIACGLGLFAYTVYLHIIYFKLKNGGHFDKIKNNNGLINQESQKLVGSKKGKYISKQPKLKPGPIYGIFTWCILCIAVAMILMWKYGYGAVIGMSVFFFPFVLCAVLIPIFLLYDKAIKR